MVYFSESILDPPYGKVIEIWHQITPAPSRGIGMFESGSIILRHTSMGGGDQLRDLSVSTNAAVIVCCLLTEANVSGYLRMFVF